MTTPLRRPLATFTTLAALAALLPGCAVPSAPPGPAVVKVKIVGFNDFHGNLLSPGSFSPATQSSSSGAALVPAGGADVLAGFVERLKAQNPNHIVVGAGDFIGASPLVSALFHDEPTVEVMNRIGLEFNAVGNHEFDKGSAELLRLQAGGCALLAGQPDPNSCRGAAVGTPVPFEGAKFQWLSANVVSAASGKTLLPAQGIKRFEGIAVAFIGMTLRDTPTIVTPTGVAGLRFQDEADTVNALLPALRKQGVEAVVVLLHQGGAQTGSGDINGCAGNMEGTAVAEVVARLDDAVDLVLSGHTHTAYNCKLPNAKGRLIPVTQAGAFGRVLTDIDIELTRATRDVTSVAATNRVVDRSDVQTTPNAAVAGIVDAYNGLAKPIADTVIGRSTQALPQANTFDAACNMPAGDLVADAQLAATTAADLGGAQFALMNRGGVRSPGFTFPSSPAGEGDGAITYGEAFTAQPFGNALVTVTLTAQQVKDVLEQQFAGCRGQAAAATRILIPSRNFRFAWDGSKACDNRISRVTLATAAGAETLVDADGKLVAAGRSYRVTINNFLSTGGDSFTVFAAGARPLGGPQDIDALVSFLADTRSRPYDAVANTSIGAPRITRLNTPAATTGCATGANTNP